MRVPGPRICPYPPWRYPPTSRVPGWRLRGVHICDLPDPPPSSPGAHLISPSPVTPPVYRGINLPRTKPAIRPVDVLDPLAIRVPGPWIRPYRRGNAMVSHPWTPGEEGEPDAARECSPGRELPPPTARDRQGPRGGRRGECPRAATCPSRRGSAVDHVLCPSRPTPTGRSQTGPPTHYGGEKTKRGQKCAKGDRWGDYFRRAPCLSFRGSISDQVFV